MVKGSTGPAEKPIDLQELEKLCALQCTQRDLASWFDVSLSTIERRQRDPEFAAVMERGYARGRVSLRRKQMQLAEAGNATMLVWLGKQILGQRDHVDQTIATPDGSRLKIEIVRVAVDRNREIEDAQSPASLPSPLRPV